MIKTVLLTGATGFIGTQIARYLLEDEQVLILALVRANSSEEAKRRLERNWWDWPELIQALEHRVEVIHGDVSLPHIGLNETEYESVAKKTTHIIHTAADWRPHVSLDELRKTNVHGTANILKLAEKIHKQHRLQRLSHISTAYVAGGRTGIVPEDTLTDEFGFFSHYEHSKYEGELLVQAAKKELPISVFRPSMVIGDSQTGAIKTFNTFYFPLRLYLTGKMQIMPVKRSLRINVVPVDYVAKVVAKLTFEPKAEGLNFHVVAPYESLPRLDDLLISVQSWGKMHLGLNLPAPFCINMSPSAMKTFLKVIRIFKRGDRRILNSLISLSPYFSEDRQLQRNNLDKLYGPYDLKWQKFMPNILEYSIYNSFFHRSDRTVYEQVMFRLDSRSYPITYFDIADGKVLPKTAREIRKEIIFVANALSAVGIKAGDRVGLTGLNSTRYLTIDVAIGILGAVSVPIYYTSPPAETDKILRASGAKLFFVGMPELLQRTYELKANIPIISFCRNLTPQNKNKNVIEWRDFISQTLSNTMQGMSPVGFGDIATLRYSSGTTGEPKGVIFKHENLRYMAESAVSILSWRARNRQCSYLSYLPMGHVVEGILATYSPYYVPAPIKIYFLEDFKKIQTALPIVRPIVFFSVPRLYEKMWKNLGKNKLGNAYLKRQKGLTKRVLGRILKRMMLKRAGLDKCEQLIAGSARFDENLLLKYRELGIEIHNAYGLTEAPLVTLNRMGKNRITTVGEPMPQTQVKTAEDGEIMVKGPQVTSGYFEKKLEPPIKKGWLMTGDVGKVTDEGSLIIFGRKKDLIKTSYGKCIYSGKIEDLIKGATGVSEAMLIGESKPYCTALLWIDKKQYNKEALSSIDKSIVEMNKQLSNPEKIKKWALLENDLSIETGELTPNLKLRRNDISKKHAKIIDALYTGKIPEGKIHISGVEKQGE